MELVLANLFFNILYKSEKQKMWVSLFAYYHWLTTVWPLFPVQKNKKKLFSFVMTFKTGWVTLCSLRVGSQSEFLGYGRLVYQGLWLGDESAILIVVIRIISFAFANG